MVAALAGFALGLGTHVALAQNAAQRAALARLSLARSSAQPDFTPPSGTTEASNFYLYQPAGLAFDAAGDLFIADSGDNVILKVNVDGIVSVVAGTGAQGYGGDGGAATSALLDSPAGVAVGTSGNIYIADTHNNRIRKVSGGTITTIAGSGVVGYSGDGAAAAAATLSYPTALAVDSNGNIYIADTNNHRIREITGTTINTVAGNGAPSYSGDGGLATAAGLDSPNGVAVDAAFNIYIGDTHNQRVRMVTFATGKISTIAGTGVKGFNGDGLATTAELALPGGVAVGASGVYVADSDNDRIRLISGGQITTIAGNGSEGYSGDSGVSTNAALDTPRTIAVYGSTVVFSDTENQAVREVNGGELNTLAGSSSNSVESLTLSGATTTIYGSGTGTLTATIANGSKTATGPVTLVDGLGTSPALVGTTSLSANSASFNTILLTAGTHYLVATYPGDANNPAITSSVYVLAVTQAQSNTALTTTNTTFILGAPPTLKATVTSTNGAPTGTVNFYDGLTLLNAAPVALSGGVAQLILTTLPVGLGQSLTAVYSGDTNFLTSTSTAVTENVITPDFNITSPTPAQTVLPVSSVNYTITLTPTNPTFVYPVTYSVTSTLPTGVTASFNPTSINAGAGASSTVLTLTASAQARTDERIHSIGGAAAPMVLALLLLPMAFSRRARKTARQLSRFGKAFLALLMLAGLSALAGCGGGFFSHPTEYSTVTVTAVCGPNNHATNVTLIIK